MRLAKIAGQLGALALVLALLGLFTWKVLEDDEPLARVGGPVPAFVLPALDGSGRVRVDDSSGRPLVVNFWASWCGPCRDEAPILEAAWRKYRGRVDFVGVDIRDFNTDAKRFVDRFGLTFPMAYDGPGDTWDTWGIVALPETFVVDASGTIVARTTVIEDAAMLDDAIEKALL